VAQDGDRVEVEESEEIVARVAAIDVAKASGMVCTRVPHPARPGQRATKVWQVPATTNAIIELADQLACQGIQRVVVESTSEDWRPFVYLLEARGLRVWLAGARDARAPARPPQDRQARCGVAGQAQRAGHAAALVRPARPDPPVAGGHPAAVRPDRRACPARAAAGAGCSRTP
jgi:transposase